MRAVSRPNELGNGLASGCEIAAGRVNLVTVTEKVAEGEEGIEAKEVERRSGKRMPRLQRDEQRPDARGP